ncbi:MAG: hypothetical protein Q9211_004376 [Gyalolechia sp. 1 TL-2023]
MGFNSMFSSTPSLPSTVDKPAAAYPPEIAVYGKWTPPVGNITFRSTHAVQAHRFITQAVIVGARVFGRAFAEAYRQASASSKHAQSSIGSSGSSTSRNFITSRITLDEACKILNVRPPQGGKANLEEVMERFKRLFDVNDPAKGGSFYLQSKILRARERIEQEVREAEEAAEREAELKGGWRPKLYKDR